MLFHDQSFSAYGWRMLFPNMLSWSIARNACQVEGGKWHSGSWFNSGELSKRRFCQQVPTGLNTVFVCGNLQYIWQSIMRFLKFLASLRERYDALNTESVRAFFKKLQLLGPSLNEGLFRTAWSLCTRNLVLTFMKMECRHVENVRGYEKAGRCSFFNFLLMRQKKKICGFPVSSYENLGRVGRF
jgi:hypothetical protein